MRRTAFLLLGFAVATAAPAWAQLENCNIVYSENLSGMELGGGRTMTRVEGPMAIRCAGGVTVSADNAVRYEPDEERRFIGNVVYEDSTQTITSDLLISYGREDRIVARGNVHFTDLTTGSTIRGTEMERFTRTFPAGEERTIVRGRPHAVFHREQPPPGDTAAPLVMDADSMIIRGRSQFRGSGAVQFERGELSGLGEQVALDEGAGTLEILGSLAAGKRGAPLPATLNTERFTLTGERIDADLDGEQIEQLTATGDAFLDGQTARIRGAQLHLFFEASRLNRLVGTARVAADFDVEGRGEEDRPELTERPEREPVQTARPGELPVPRKLLRDVRSPSEAPARSARQEAAEEAAEKAAEAPREEVRERPRVVATAEGLRMVADSLEILAPGEVVEQLTAVGDALGERLPADSAAAEAADLPEVIARDWIRGDTIVGWFAEGPPPAPGDTAERVLERLMAVGGGRPASSLHHMRSEAGADGPNVNYLKEARRITIQLEAGEVVDVTTEGPVVGIYLTRGQSRTAPAEAAPDTGAVPPDTTAAPVSGAAPPDSGAAPPETESGQPAPGVTPPTGAAARDTRTAHPARRSPPWGTA